MTYDVDFTVDESTGKPIGPGIYCSCDGKHPFIKVPIIEKDGCFYASCPRCKTIIADESEKEETE